MRPSLALTWTSVALGVMLSVKTALSDNDGPIPTAANTPQYVSLQNGAFANLPVEQQVKAFQTCFDRAAKTGETDPAQTFRNPVQFARDTLLGQTEYASNADIRYYTLDEGTVVKIAGTNPNMPFAANKQWHAETTYGCTFTPVQ